MKSTKGMVGAMTEAVAEIVVDSGSVANVCPPEFGAEYGFTTDEVPKLFNVNYEALKCYGMRNVPIMLKCDDGTWWEAQILFVVANVAYPVLSVGKMISNGYTCVVAPTGSFIAKNGRRVGVQTRGKTFIMEGKLGTAIGRKHKEIGENVVAPVTRGLGPGRPPAGPDDEISASSDGTGLPATQASALKPPEEVQKMPQKPNPTEVKKHELLHLPYASWCEVCIAAKGQEQ